MSKTTKRPPSVWVEVWGDPKAQQEAIVAWGKEKRAVDKCRAKHKLVEQIPKSEEQEYIFLMRDMLEKYGEKKPPAMPCTFTSDEIGGQAVSATAISGGNFSRKKTKLTQKERNSRRKQRVHMENIQPIGDVHEEYMAMIHTEVKHEEMKKYRNQERP